MTYRARTLPDATGAVYPVGPAKMVHRTTAIRALQSHRLPGDVINVETGEVVTELRFTDEAATIPTATHLDGWDPESENVGLAANNVLPRKRQRAVKW